METGSGSCDPDLVMVNVNIDLVQTMIMVNWCVKYPLIFSEVMAVQCRGRVILSHEEMLQNRKKPYRHTVTGVKALMMVTTSWSRGRGRAALVELGVQLGAVEGCMAHNFSRYCHGVRGIPMLNQSFKHAKTTI